MRMRMKAKTEQAKLEDPNHRKQRTKEGRKERKKRKKSR